MDKRKAEKELELVNMSYDFGILKKMYKSKVLKWHPDLARLNNISIDEATRKTQKLISAYNFLKTNFPNPYVNKIEIENIKDYASNSSSPLNGLREDDIDNLFSK